MEHKDDTKVMVETDDMELELTQFHQKEEIHSFCSGCHGVTSATKAFFS
jgi:hypothetical protein